jgi:hypothetical protein
LDNLTAATQGTPAPRRQSYLRARLSAPRVDELAHNKPAAHRKGFEPLTPRFVVWCSIQLRRRAATVILAVSENLAKIVDTAPVQRDVAALGFAFDVQRCSRRIAPDRQNAAPKSYP